MIEITGISLIKVYVVSLFSRCVWLSGGAAVLSA